MHHALAIPELQFAIARVCASFESSHAHLYRLSLVSWSWKNIVEPLLWENVDLWDLLYLSPAWTRLTREEDGTRVMHAERAVTASDWEFVSSRSRFTRRLFVNCHGAMDEAVLATLPPAETLFPQLENMTLSAYKPPSFLVSRFLVALIPHTLAHLIIHCASFVLRGIQALVAARCVHLRSLEMTKLAFPADIRSPSPCAAFLESLRDCSELADVDIAFYAFEFRESFLCSLAAYPSLRRLKLEVREEDMEEEPEELGVDHSAFPTSGFPVLQSLEVSAVPWQTVIAALRSIGGGSALTTIIITADVPDYESYHAIVAAIGAAGDPAHLTTISFDGFCTSLARGQPFSVLDVRSLAPLSKFRRLENLDTRGLARSALTNDDCAEIARWWPELTNLSLVTDTSERPSCTLEVMRTFCLCPRLTRLRIALAETE
ncbi:hypothetical protein BD626DRAFT_517618 [Schizophyllum amplum]|uniref:F-box domain-containing protein n=1 Tax=Schizophyllum amplum TaxID=97359 RepID=A0A550BW64_9AGAR|nr:hypothetical protein BD626DRAFT_517618 [Auriculariopsis ampla]